MTEIIPQVFTILRGTPKPVATGLPASTPVSFDQTFQSSTHATLTVPERNTPEPPSSQISVSIIDGSRDKTVKMQLLETDTVKKVKELLKEKPVPEVSLGLACNGKPVAEHQTLRKLSVRGQVTFITYQRCAGG